MYQINMCVEKVKKILQNIIKRNNLSSICKQKNEINYLTYSRIKENTLHSDLIVFDKEWNVFNSILIKSYDYNNYIPLYYTDRFGKQHSYRVEDFTHLLIIPKHIELKEQNMIIIPSQYAIDHHISSSQAIWRENKYGGLTRDRSKQQLFTNFRYIDYIYYPYNTGIFAKKMLNPK